MCFRDFRRFYLNEYKLTFKTSNNKFFSFNKKDNMFFIAIDNNPIENKILKAENNDCSLLILKLIKENNKLSIIPSVLGISFLTEFKR